MENQKNFQNSLIYLTELKRQEFIPLLKHFFKIGSRKDMLEK